MKRILTTQLLLCLILCLTACQKNDGSFSVKQEKGDALEFRLMEVWQDTDQNVMVSLAGTGKGTLLDVAAKWSGDQIVGRVAMPKIQVQILVDGGWIASKDYPEGMFDNADNGTLTIHFPVTTLPSR